MNPLNVCKENIWTYRQNRPSLIAKDLEELYGIDRHESFLILMARGVFKWFSVRMDIIRLKNKMKRSVRKAQEDIVDYKYILRHLPKDFLSERSSIAKRLYHTKGYLKAKEEDRAAIRKLCHSERWQCPPRDIEIMGELK